jgi:glyoxylase-like metal-dependent hydrolase (beta-lactamase superfamily II)
VMRIGDLTIHAISDGVFVAKPGYFGGGVPADARPEVFDRGGTAWLPIGCFLIRSASRVVLVDCGLGPTAKALPDGMRLAGGRLLTELRAAGSGPGEVTDVVCTHLHSDHVGWLFDRNGEQVFAAATIWFGAADWGHFVTGPGEIGEHIRRGFRMAARSRLRPVHADTELARGVSAVLTPGHTPGHLCVRLTSAGRCAWLAGDAITCPVQLLEPGWHSFGDVDPALAERSRDFLWDELRRPDTTGTGAHFPGLQFGHVRDDPHPRWVTGSDHR